MTLSTPFWEAVVEGVLAEVIGSVVMVGLLAAVRSVRRKERQPGDTEGGQT